jgi:hypothetical protein
VRWRNWLDSAVPKRSLKRAGKFVRKVSVDLPKATGGLLSLGSPRSGSEFIGTVTRLYPMVATHFFRSQRLWSANSRDARAKYY